MATIAIVDTALSGFRLIREDFKSVLVWTGAYLAYALFGFALTIALGGEALQELAGIAGQGGAASPEALLSTYGKLAPLYAVSFPLGMAFMIVMQAAVYRATLKPSEGGPGHLRFSRDEFHLAIVNVVLGLVMIGVYIALILAFVLLAAGIAAALAAAGGDGATAIGIILIPVGFIAFFGAFLYIAIRLSLAGPQTLAEGKLNLFGSWALTKGKVRRLLGAYALTGVVVLIIYIVVAAVAGGLLGAAMLNSSPVAAVTAMTTVTPATIALLAGTTLFGVFVMVTLGTPPAYAYRQLMPSHAEVFD